MAYQMTVFNVNWQPSAHSIRLPSALLISEDEERSNSFDEKFERWALDNKTQAIWDKVPQLVFKVSQGNYCKSIEALKIRLRKAREENDFSEWLKCHTPTNKLAKEKYDGYFLSRCSLRDRGRCLVWNITGCKTQFLSVEVLSNGYRPLHKSFE